MKRIDRETVQRILDSADIVDVVSDFVQLKRRGSNYVGLCPFHDDRSPSFYVSRAKGICKCFSCGKSASAVSFVMEHESMSYTEALRYLAKKYGIEIKERELTDEERRQADARESLLAVNDFALGHFEHNLRDTDDGRDIGLSYFRHRGINDAMIERFHLGYSLVSSDALYRACIEKGFTGQVLVDSGLCIHTDKDTWYDRFRGRVIFPVFSISGRVVAFGGRTLKTEKSVAKYVNSPESAIYSKSHELYGLYQAKNAISKQNKCILVEGYLDVISMHQSGVENVVASSGTSLTTGQIKLIKRFTPNVTVIYDSDAAGVKASLRGINLLLAEGMNIKVVLLPDGDDPDSFAQHHSSSEVEDYIKTHEVDFIRFKTEILLADAGDDPVKRATVIKDIVDSIAVIPDPVTRTVYLQDCARNLSIDEKVLSLQIAKATAEEAEKKGFRDKRNQAENTINVGDRTDQASKETGTKSPALAKHPDTLARAEISLIRYCFRYGLFNLVEAIDDEPALNVIDYVSSELQNDGIEFSNVATAKLYHAISDFISKRYADDYARFCTELQAKTDKMREEGIRQISEEGKSLGEIQSLETDLNERLRQMAQNEKDQFIENYLIHAFISDPDDDIRNLATDLAAERYHLSKVHYRYGKIETERERLVELVPRAVVELKNEIIEQRLADLRATLATAAQDEISDIMTKIQSMQQIRGQLAHVLGERTITPAKRK